MLSRPAIKPSQPARRGISSSSDSGFPPGLKTRSLVNEYRSSRAGPPFSGLNDVGVTNTFNFCASGSIILYYTERRIEMTVRERIAESFLIPVVVMDDADKAPGTAGALLKGGIKVMEITLRTEAGLKAIEKVAGYSTDMLVGAGTVLSLEKCREAVSRGAAFIVSPGFDAEIVDYCQKNNVDVFPGCVTPTEITAAIKAGLSVLKFFPANVYGGALAIKALSGPFPDIKFIPTGGVDNKNLAEFIIPQVFAIGGGWLCDRKQINSGDFTAITAACETALKTVSETKANKKTEFI
jgi:2-dehydro-3-deoxyphosphogluconate aldolase/(4S)-4-hydroxy-2-oxoglutarate aldolase